jgi:predicted Zn-dependent peptidase
MKYLHYIPTNNEFFSVQVFFAVGSINEQKGQYGISHFLEHMKFKETQHLHGDKLMQILDDIGAFHNAFTSKDQTSYYIRCLSKHWKTALDVMNEMAFCTVFSHNSIDTERKVVLEEMYKRFDNPTVRILDKADNTIFHKDNPYHHDTIGILEDLMAATNKTLKEYNDLHYNDNYTIVITGPAKHKRSIIKHARSLYNLPQNVTRVVDKMANDHNINKFEFSIMADYANTQQYITMLTFRSFPRSDPRSYVVDLLYHILSSGNQTPSLMYEIREKRGLVYSIRCINMNYLHVGLFHVLFASSYKHTHKIIAVIKKVLATLHKKLTQSKLNRYKKSYIDRIKYDIINTESNAEFVGQELFYNPKFSVNRLIKLINNVKLSTILSIAAFIFDFEKMGVMSVGKYKSPERTVDDIHHVLKA